MLNAKCAPRALTLAGAALQAAVAVAALGLAQPWSGRTGPAALATSVAASQEGDFRTALTPDGKGIVRRPPPYDHGRGPLEALPAYDPANKRDIWQIDLRGWDLSALDLGGRLNDLLMAHFDAGTRWPRRLPRGFDPGRIMECGRTPASA
jgi:hypothetical protein